MNSVSPSAAQYAGSDAGDELGETGNSPWAAGQLWSQAVSDSTISEGGWTVKSKPPSTRHHQSPIWDTREIGRFRLAFVRIWLRTGGSSLSRLHPWTTDYGWGCMLSCSDQMLLLWGLGPFDARGEQQMLNNMAPMWTLRCWTRSQLGQVVWHPFTLAPQDLTPKILPSGQMPKYSQKKRPTGVQRDGQAEAKSTWAGHLCTKKMWSASILDPSLKADSSCPPSQAWKSVIILVPVHGWEEALNPSYIEYMSKMSGFCCIWTLTTANLVDVTQVNFSLEESRTMDWRPQQQSQWTSPILPGKLRRSNNRRNSDGVCLPLRTPRGCSPALTCRGGRKEQLISSHRKKDSFVDISAARSLLLLQGKRSKKRCRLGSPIGSTPPGSFPGPGPSLGLCWASRSPPRLLHTA
ncbi:cysteine protease ATG4D-like protein [Lates japonicus]|uniref:Cysteine protease ATG4D-like protein n=1 Tax=Lates japonicus TaxID=270547 RepID=A0AAD3RFR8_LATJO|nr:cysteine protease ATG4D-like protein [Lates japonicus]